MFDCIYVWFSLGLQSGTSCTLEVQELCDGRGRGLFTVHGAQQGMDLCWFHGEVLLKLDLQVAEAPDFSKVIMVEPDVFLRAPVRG